MYQHTHTKSIATLSDKFASTRGTNYATIHGDSAEHGLQIDAKFSKETSKLHRHQRSPFNSCTLQNLMDDNGILCTSRL